MAKPKPILILNGPNLNLLGTREPEIYGQVTLDEIEQGCMEHARGLDFAVDFRQSNHEGELIDWVQEAGDKHSGIVINAGAYSHSSLAIMDAMTSVQVPAVEVHLSNVYAREAFRHKSVLSSAVTGVIVGLGALGYLLALDALSVILSGGEDG